MNQSVISGIAGGLMMCAILAAEGHAQPAVSKTFYNRDVMIVAANSAGGTSLFDRIRYNPTVVYEGDYLTNALYYHNRNNPVWRIGLKVELDRITCRPALESFRTTGLWGGHFQPDGSCGDTTEPTEWATGNWLNFNDARGR